MSSGIGQNFLPSSGTFQTNAGTDTAILGSQTIAVQQALFDKLVNLGYDQETVKEAFQYLADSNTPQLPLPKDTNGSQPYNVYQRVLITMDFEAVLQKKIADYVASQYPNASKEEKETRIKQLIDSYNSGDEPSQEPSLKNLTEQANTQIIEKYSLPSSWNAQSKNLSSWTPASNAKADVPADPYDNEVRALIEGEFDSTVQYLMDSKTDASWSDQDLADLRALINNPNLTVTSTQPGLKNLAAFIRQQAIKTTQEQYDLPKNWTPQSTNNADWTPMTSTLNPYAVASRQSILNEYNEAVMNKIMEETDSSWTPQDIADLQELIHNPNAAISSTKPNIRKLADAIRQSVITLIQNKYHLQSSWTPASSLEEDWTPTSLTKKTMGQAEREAINAEYQAAVNAMVDINVDNSWNAQDIADLKALIDNPDAAITSTHPSLQTFAAIIRSRTLAAIQSKYSLPETWVPETTNNIDWTPIEVKGINPKQFERLYATSILSNAITYLDNIQSFGQAMLSQMNPNDPTTIAMGDFVQAIAEAIGRLKKFLYELEGNDANRIKGLSASRLEVIDLQAQTRKTQAELAQKAEKQAEKMKTVSTSLQIVAIVLTVVAIVASVVTGGASLALIAVSVIMLSLTIADSSTGFMSKGFQEIGRKLAEGLKEIMGEDAPEWSVQLVEALIYVTIIVTIIALSQGSATGQAAQLGQQFGVQMAKQTALSVAKQVTIQIVAQAAICSGCFSKLSAEMAKAMFPNSELGQQIAEVITMIIMIAVLMALVGFGMSRANTVKVTTKTITPDGEEIKTIVKESMQDYTQVFKERYPVVGKVLDKMSSKYGNYVELGALFSNDAISAGGSIAIGIMFLQQAQLELEKGDMESAEQILQALIDLLSSLIKKIQSGDLGHTAEMISQATEIVTKMYQGLEQNLSKLFQAGTAA